MRPRPAIEPPASLEARLRVGIVETPPVERSVAIYVRNVLQKLPKDVLISPFPENRPRSPVPRVVWEPTSTDSRPLHRSLWSMRCPTVVTVHGSASMTLGREAYPTRARAAFGRWTQARNRWAWKRSWGRAVAVITVSDFAKSEIASHLGLPPSQIEVIPHGVDHQVFFPGQSGPSEQILLFVGSHQPIKNLNRVLDAYAAASLARPVPLVAVVPGAPPELAASRPRVHWVREPLTQAELAALYRRSVALVAPSLRESFGLPLLEAMASGCPVLTSRGSACEETTRGASLLVDPRSTREIRQGIEEVLRNSPLRNSLRFRGLERARSFSWARSAQAHAEVFRRLSSQPLTRRAGD